MVLVGTIEIGTSLGSVRIGARAAELWYARVGAHAADVERFSRHFLSDDEREHTRRYRGREAAERYVLTRSLTRAVLARRLGAVPRELPVTRTASGKPIAAQLHFNVSHSGDLILLAVCDAHAVGVDVERKRDVPRVRALAQRWLSESERAELRRREVAGAAPSDAFLRVWSLKEARLKALGVGIAGAGVAELGGVDAVALDDVLLERVASGGDHGYVGAIAFA